MKDIIVYSEARGKFLGETDWVSTTMCARPFNTENEARQAVRTRTPKGKTESIVLFRFVSREVSGFHNLLETGAMTVMEENLTGIYL